MKKIIKYYIISILSLLIFTVLTSLILTILKSNDIISYNNSIIISYIISYLLVAILSFILGLKLKRHGLIHGLLMSIILLSLNLIFFNSLSDISNLIKVITKTIIIIFFTILGVNKSK